MKKTEKEAKRPPLRAESAPKSDKIPLYGSANPDPVLSQKGGLKGLSVYEDLESDSRTFAALAKRKRAVTGKEWTVEASGEDDASAKAADFARDCLAELGIDRLTSDMMSAILLGYSITEVIWEDRDGFIVPVRTIGREPDRFAFGPRKESGEYEIRLLSPGSKDGELMPEKKFIHFVHDSRYDSPYGRGAGNPLYWPVYFKRRALTFWLVHADKYGSPTSVGKYPVSASDADKDTLLAALKALSHDSGVVLPEGMDIKLLETASSGSEGVFQALIRYMDEQIAEVLLGETGTINQSSGEGSRARDEVADDIRTETAKADSDNISECLNRGLLTWMTELNFPGAAPPKFWRIFEEPMDSNLKAERDAKVAAMGARFTKKYFMRAYDLEEDEVELAPAYDPFGSMQGFSSSGSKKKSPESLPEKEIASQDAEAFDASAEEPLEDDEVPDGVLSDFNAMSETALALIGSASGYEEAEKTLAGCFGVTGELLSESLQRAFFAGSMDERLKKR